MAKATTEDYSSIDVRILARKGVLEEGMDSCLLIHRTRVSAITVATQLDRVVMRYKVLGPGGEWDQIEEPISLDRTKAGPGWERVWFLCPGCGKRVAILYLKKYYFRCRHCFGLVYQSQRMTRSQRASMRSGEIRW